MSDVLFKCILTRIHKNSARKLRNFITKNVMGIVDGELKEKQTLFSPTFLNQKEIVVDSMFESLHRLLVIEM